MTKELICDTTFYFSPSRDILEDKNIKIIGTKWNGWEIATSSRFREKGFKHLKKAATNFLSIPNYYIEQSPIVYNMAGQYSERSQVLSNKSYKAIKAILKRIVNAESFDDYENHDSFIDFRSYDNAARRSMENFLRQCVAKAKELSSEYIPQLMFEIFNVNYKEMTYDWYNKHFNIIIYRNNISLDPVTPFVQTLLAYFEDLYSGATSVGKNDFNDLMHLIYLDNQYYFNTDEKNWIKYLDSIYDEDSILIL